MRILAVMLVLFMTWPELFGAMTMVECFPGSRDCEDSAQHIGPYQISEWYWKMSDTPGTWEMVEDPEYAQKVMMNFWLKYAYEDVARGDMERLARIHNGGLGFGRSTDKYWARILCIYRGVNWWDGRPLTNP